MKKRIDLPQVSDVTLPEVFHLRPGIWILIILATLIVALIFIVAFLPGIIKGGRYITFEAPLPESGIILDGTYLGSADHQYFIKSGDYTITFVKGGVEYATERIHIDHPILLTHFIHRTRTIPIALPSLSAAMKETIIRYDLSEIQRASAILDWTMVTRYAPLYQNLAQDITALQYPVEDAIALALSFISSEEMLDDAKLAFSSYTAPAVQTRLKSAELRLGGTQTTSDISQIPGSAVTTRASTLHTDLFAIEGTAYPATRIAMGSSGDPSSNEYSVAVDEEAFVMANLPVTITQWAHFIDENPQWAKANTTTLHEKGLVDTSYLAGLAPSTIFVTSRPITNISYYASLAFCTWLSEKSGSHVFLPTEAMYTVAAKNQSTGDYHASLTPPATSTNSPAMLLGGVWEITQTPFIPLARLSGYQQTIDLHSRFGLEPHPIVKGGSYLNRSDAITADTVGTIFPDTCADQIGFRIAWYE